MTMDPGEICRDYKAAKRKNEQVKILAQLNECTEQRIVEILKEGGIDGRSLPRKYTRDKQKQRSADKPVPSAKKEQVTREEKPAPLPGRKPDVANTLSNRLLLANIDETICALCLKLRKSTSASDVHFYGSAIRELSEARRLVL